LTDLPDDVTNGMPIIVDNATTRGRLPSGWSHPVVPATPVTTTTLDVSDNAVQERTQLQEALAAANGNKAQAARGLNMPRSTFYSKLKKLGIDGSGNS